MSAKTRNQMREVMLLAWQFVKRNGYTMAEALKAAWANIKLKVNLYNGIVKFYFRKVDGTMREAYGTLRGDLVAQTKGCDRKPNPTIQTYFDTEKQEYRCFKKANLVY